MSNGNANITITSSGVELTVEQGQPGIGVPAGGTTGQVLAKASNADYDTVWSAGGGGAVTSVTGTANEVEVSPTTGAVVVGLPDAITVVEVNAERVDFDTTPTTPADAIGREYWDTTYNTLSLGLSADVNLKQGQALYKRGRNSSNTTAIPKGAVVYVAGSHAGTELMVSLADADSEATSAYTIGVAAEEIAANSTGFVQVFGYLSGITTNGYSGAEGTALYLSSTAGEMSSTVPTQPKHGVRVGFLVKKAGAGAGSIFVNVQNYQELEELSDVLIGAVSGGTALADLDLLSYDSTTGVWRNRTLANAGVAPSSADYLVRTANAGLSAERVVSDSTTVTANWATAGQVAFERAALTGDVTASANSNATTIANDAVTFAKFQNVNPAILLGRESGAGIGDPKEIVLDTQFVWTAIGGKPALTISVPSDASKANASLVLTAGTGLTGGGDLSANRTFAIATSGVTTTLVADANITYAKIQDVTAASRLLGRGSASGSGDVQEITLGTNLTMNGTTLDASGGSVPDFLLINAGII